VDTTAKQIAPKPLKYDTNYIEKFDELMAIEPWIAAPSFVLRLDPEDDSLITKHNNYQPYLRDVVGFDVAYKAVILSIGFKGPIIPEDEEVFGKTKYSILKLRLNSTPFVYEFYHNTFNGFADYNASNYDSTRISEDHLIKRQDLKVQYTKLKAIYIFSQKKFSYGAAYSFSERQKLTKATGFLVGHAYRYSTEADSSFFNRGQENIFGKYERLKKLKVLSVGIGPGFAATFVEKNWFFSFGVYVMGDLQHHTAFEDKNEELSKGWNGALLGDAFVSAGYNSRHFYAGIVARGDRNMIALPTINASTTFYSTVLSIGFRFNPPKFVPKLYNSTPLKYF
jgi:hypothetical protein